MPTVTLEYYGMEGSGRTLTEAKRDAGRKIEAALSGSYTPEIIAYRGYATLVFRMPDGWGYRVISGDGGIRAGAVHSAANDRTREEAMRSAYCHLADITREPGDKEPPEFITSREDKREWHTKQEFQARYTRARAAGCNDHDAHNYACGGLGRPDIIERVDGPKAVVAM